MASSNASKKNANISDSYRNVAEMISGGMGSATGLFVSHPLDTVKTRLQVSSSSDGLLSTLRGLIADGGVRGLWRGAAAPVLTVASTTSVVFTINSAIRQALLHSVPSLSRANPHHVRDPTQPERVLAHSGYYVAGFVGGAIASMFTGPAELAKTKVQAQGLKIAGQSAEAAAVRYTGSLHCLYEVGRNYGLAGVFQGQLSCMWRNAIGQCAYFGTYNLVVDWMKPKDAVAVPLQYAVAGGAIAGIAYWTFSYPVDVLKSKITAEPSDPAHRRFSNMRQAAKYIMQREGIGGFFKGYIPTLARGVSCNAVVFPVYELFKQYAFGIQR